MDIQSKQPLRMTARNPERARIAVPSLLKAFSRPAEYLADVDQMRNIHEYRHARIFRPSCCPCSRSLSQLGGRSESRHLNMEHICSRQHHHTLHSNRQGTN
ncbi:hypothetical protein COOONC_02285 [Cooperia oncophora]